MAIQYVGGQLASITASTTTATTVNFALTGGLASTPATDDIVIVSYGVGSTVNATIGVNTAGYTEIAELYVSDTYDANLSVSYKVMGATPDTSVDISATGLNSDGGYVVIQVFRGIDTTTPMDVTAATATGGNSGIPNPAAITPTTVGAEIVVIGATASTGGVTYTAAYLTNFLTASNTAATNDITVGAGWVDWTSGAYDPAAFTVTGSANTQSWAAVTLALRPLILTTGRPKVWTGSAWAQKPAKVWTGSAWVEKPVKYWDGTTWVTVT